MVARTRDSHRVSALQVFRNIEFPITVSRIKKHSNSTAHSHEFQELVVIVKGMGRHETEGESYTIKAGDVFVIAQGREHGYADTRDLYLINILFDLKRLNLPLLDLESLPGYHALFKVEPHLRKQHHFKSRLSLPMDQLGRALEYVTRLEDELDSAQGGYRFMAAARLMELIGYLSRSYSEVGKRERRSVFRISELLSYMELHFSESITLETLARQVHMSQTSLRRTFTQAIGHSPIDYLIQLRIAKAQILLRRTDLRITEVAAEVGFEDSNYFSRQFRQIEGLSPREYRGRFAGPSAPAPNSR